MNRNCRRCGVRPSVRARTHADVTDLWKDATNPFVVQVVEICNPCRSDATAENRNAVHRRTLNAPRLQI